MNESIYAFKIPLQNTNIKVPLYFSPCLSFWPCHFHTAKYGLLAMCLQFSMDHILYHLYVFPYANSLSRMYHVPFLLGYPLEFSTLPETDFSKNPLTCHPLDSQLLWVCFSIILLFTAAPVGFFSLNLEEIFWYIFSPNIQKTS